MTDDDGSLPAGGKVRPSRRGGGLGRSGKIVNWCLPMVRAWGASTVLALGIGTIPVFAQSQTDTPKQIQDRIAEEPESAEMSDRVSELAVMPDQLICKHALDWPNPIWQPNPYAAEAKRRFLTVNDCFTMKQTSAPGAATDVDRAIDIRVCQRALDARKLAWETLSNFRKYVEAAAGRALTISRCRELLDLANDNRAATGLRSLDTSIVCIMSFEPKTDGSSRWQMKPPQDSYVAELDRRYTTEARCRDLLGI